MTVRQDWADDGKGGTSLGFGAVVQHASFVLADFVYLHSRDPARHYNPSFLLSSNNAPPTQLQAT